MRILPITIMMLVFVLLSNLASAQCSICTRTAQQLGEQSAKGLNFGILYLALAPFLIVGVIAYRFWKRNKAA